MKTVSPSKFAHVVFQTHRFEEMIDWYQFALGAHIVHQTSPICFLTYDEEHHRVAFLDKGPFEGGGDIPSKDPEAVGTHHLAFTWETLEGLLVTYKRFKEERNIMPLLQIRHGPTLALYYTDPDGNSLEFQIDLYTNKEADRFMESDAFAANPGGELFDCEDLISKFESGEPVEDLIYRSDQFRPAEPIKLR